MEMTMRELEFELCNCDRFHDVHLDGCNWLRFEDMREKEQFLTAEENK